VLEKEIVIRSEKGLAAITQKSLSLILVRLGDCKRKRNSTNNLVFSDQ
jgi:hypothetical protein